MSGLEGLYAVGECSGGMHGSNRLGGNSLSDLLVFGKRSGRGGRLRGSGGRDPHGFDVNLTWKQPTRWPSRCSMAPAPVPRTPTRSSGAPADDERGPGRGTIRTGAEVEKLLDEIETCKERAKNLLVEGDWEHNSGHTWRSTCARPLVAECIAKVLARARGVARRTHPRHGSFKPGVGDGRSSCCRSTPHAGTARRPGRTACLAG